MNSERGNTVQGYRMGHLPSVAGMLLLTLFTLAALWKVDWNASRFVLAGDVFVQQEQVPQGFAVIPDSTGYDGQFFYRFALAPFLFENPAHGVRVDAPEFRHQRILYPLLAWGLSLSRQELVPWALLLVNLLSLVGLAFMGPALARQCGQPGWMGLALPLYSGFLFSLTRDLAEPLCVFWTALFVLLWLRERFAWAIAALVCAVLTRDSVLVAAMAGVLVSGWQVVRHKSLWNRYLLFALPFVVYYGLKWYIGWRWQLVGEPAFAGYPFEFAPFAEYLRHVRNIFTGAGLRYFTKYELLVLAFFLCWALLRLPRAAAPAVFKLTFLGYVCLFAILPQDVWAASSGYLRILSNFFLFGMLVVWSSAPRNGRVAWLFFGLFVGHWGVLAWKLLRNLQPLT